MFWIIRKDLITQENLITIDQQCCMPECPAIKSMTMSRDRQTHSQNQVQLDVKTPEVAEPVT